MGNRKQYVSFFLKKTSDMQITNKEENAGIIMV